MLVEVARVDALPEGRVTAVVAGGRSIALVKWRDRVHAVRNVCPHQSQSFEQGLVRPAMTSPRAGELGFDEGRPVLACPCHHFQFDLRTGRCVVDPALRVKAYPLRIADGKVFVEIGNSLDSDSRNGD